jgi:hypothetical protein
MFEEEDELQIMFNETKTYYGAWVKSRRSGKNWVKHNNYFAYNASFGGVNSLNSKRVNAEVSVLILFDWFIIMCF